MITSVFALLLAAFISAVLTPLIRNFAKRHGLLDGDLTPRRIHRRPVPRVGGVAIVLAFYCAVLAALVSHSALSQRLMSDRSGLLAMLLCGAAVAVLGVFDDLRGTRARTKFTVQIVLATTLYFIGFRIDCIAIPLASPLWLGPLSLPFTVLWIVGVTNAVNLIDGLDGLAGGTTLIALVAIFTLASMRSQPLMMLFSAALGGATFGFLFYNFNPASIFMGDSGSMFLGFMLATSTIKASQKASTAVAIAIPIVMLGIPILDTLAAIVRRTARHQPVFAPDKEHVHHRLLAAGLSQRKAVIVLYAVCVFFGAASLTLVVADGLDSYLVLGLVVVATGLLWLRLQRPRTELSPQPMPAPEPAVEVKQRFVTEIRR